MAKKQKGGSKTAPMRVLDDAGVAYDVHEHAHKQFTCEGVAEDLKVPVAQVVKAMIVQRSDGQFALVVLPGDRRMSMKKVAAVLGDKGAAPASERDVLRVTGFQVGAVSVCGFRRDDIVGYIDRGVMALEQVIISSGRPDAGIAMSPTDLPKVVAGAQIGDFAEG
jgi:Cys-tRNA(Pro)/Cys-tRNA(Cys) deacylase